MVLTAICLLCLSGVPGCLLSCRSLAGQRMATLLMVVGSLLGLAGLGSSLGSAGETWLTVPWFLPWGRFAVGVDSLALVFLAPVFIVPALGSIYALGYWRQSEHSDNGRRLGIAYGVLAGSMALVVIARDGVLFLIAWEVMALAAYFAATAEEQDNPGVRRAGWVYLIATHVGTLCLLAMFALWRNTTGSFALLPAQAMSAGVAGTLFVLALIGFGCKAGLMPLHVWLPGAHANAPSHVSAVMSGVMLKMGIYGIVRLTALLPVAPAWWGGVLLAVGAVTGVAGIAFAIGQHDLKRLLAYSSIENIGIIGMGLGLALLGRAQGRGDLVLLGLAGALLHVWNHALFKSLLFLNAGAIIHAVHTREMDRLGGLAKRMPWSAALFVVGAVAICALPPFNGFASEWLLYIGFFRSLTSGGEVAMAAVALATIGALAVACFVQVLGTVFLGSSRSEATSHAHDPQACMILPMVALAVGCIAIGLFPLIPAPLLERAVQSWATLPVATPAIVVLAPMHWISAMGLSLVALIGAILLVWKAMSHAKTVGEAGTWDCGYAQPTERMQYTGSSFGDTLVGLFTFILWPKHHWPQVQGTLARKARFRSVIPDTVLDRLVVPASDVARKYLPRLRMLQQGQTQIYVLYVLAIVVLLFAWEAIGAWL